MDSGSKYLTKRSGKNKYNKHFKQNSAIVIHFKTLKLIEK